MDMVFGMYDLRLVSPIGDQAGLLLPSESLIQFLDETARQFGLLGLLEGFTVLYICSKSELVTDSWGVLYKY